MVKHPILLIYIDIDFQCFTALILSFTPGMDAWQKWNRVQASFFAPIQG